MLRVPTRFATILVAFAPVFVQARTWRHVQMLVLGALPVPGQRTICGILRIIGLRRERHFVIWHRVLNRAVWDNRLAARRLGLLLKAPRTFLLSRLHGWLVCSLADASPGPSRMPTHGSGPVRIATPSSQWTCATYSLSVLTGAP